MIYNSYTTVQVLRCIYPPFPTAGIKIQDSQWGSYHINGIKQVLLYILAGQLFIFGGHGVGHAEQLMKLDTNTLHWERVLTSGMEPGPRDSHASVFYGESYSIYSTDSS